MDLVGKKVILKKFVDEDIKEYHDWYTKSIEWQKWDAPWIKREFNMDSIIKKREANNLRNLIMTFEIYTVSNEHIGWVNAYYIDDKYIPTDTETEKIAIGLDIPNEEYREQGNGTEALNLFITYFKNNNIRNIYIQTWSGNLRMIKVAEKLRFIELNRYKEKRMVNNKKYDALTYVRSI